MAFHADAVQTMLNVELSAIAFVCVNCFVLISGYWGIKWRLKSFCNLIFQILFWGFVCFVVASLLGSYQQGLAWFISHELLSVTDRWFISAYLILYLVAPLLNSFVEQHSPRDLGKYLLLFYLFSTVWGYLLRASDFNAGMSAISLIGIYLTGVYLRRTDLKIFQLSAKTDFLIYMTIGFVLTASTCLLMSMGISKNLLGYLNPLVIVEAIYLFLFFKRLNIKSNRIINFVAASAFAVYLFHTHACIYGIFTSCCRWINQNYPWTSLGVAILYFVGIYSFCVVVDRLRILLFEQGYRFCKRNS